MTPFTESMRYDYPDLTPDSLVLDCGGYRGDFAFEINKKYGCFVNIYEPHVGWAKDMIKRFQDNPKLLVINFAVGDSIRCDSFNIHGSMTGMFVEGESFPVRVVDISNHCREPIGLLKLNIEGMEFEVLERLIATGLISNIQNIQVQFHAVFESAERRYKAIHESLAKTHTLQYCEPWCWEGWKLK